MIDKKDLSYSEWHDLFTTTIEHNFICSFQCDYCKKIFRRKDIKSYDLPLKFPTLKYTFEAGFGTGSKELYFCSLSCLFELLKSVPFGFEIITPVYFRSMNIRDKYFQKDWYIFE